MLSGKWSSHFLDSYSVPPICFSLKLVQKDIQLMHAKPVEAAIPVCACKVAMYDVGEGKVLVENVIPL
jgi:hypothetical protein